MPNRAKNIQANPDAHYLNRARLARLPASVHAVHDRGRDLVLTMLRDFFEQVDDALFELADKALSNQEQNSFFDSMRKVRVQRRLIEAGMADAIENAFAGPEAAAEPRPPGDGPLGGPHDIEEMMALDAVMTGAQQTFAAPIQELSQRLDSLLPASAYPANNPFGPETLCLAFAAQVHCLNLDLQARLLLIRVFDQSLISRLGELYQMTNQILIDHQVAVSAQDVGRRGQTEVEEPSQQDAVAGVDSPSAVLQKFLREAVAEEGAEVAPSDGQGQLLQRLSRAQELPEIGEQLATTDISLSNFLKSRGFWVDISRRDREIVKLVDRLFEIVLTDKSLAAPVKLLIARLQIPILKVALIDDSFFASTGHPARRLLNLMSMASLGWSGDTAADGNPQYDKMCQIVNELLARFDTDTGIFSELLVDLTSFLEMEQRHVQVFEQRTLDAEDGSARAEAIRNRANAEVERITRGYSLPPMVDHFIRDAWSNVIYIAGLKFGEDSTDWKTAMATLEQLVWSLQCPRTLEERQQLLERIPVLLQQVRAGLDTISYNSFDMPELFESLQAAHMACVSAPLSGDSPADAPAPLPVDTGNPGLSNPGVDTGDSHEATIELPDDDPHMRQVEAYSRGSWFEIAGDGDVPIRCRLAAYIPATDQFPGKYIFVNRSGLKVAEKTRSELAHLLKLGTLRPLDNSMLFDRALEKVIGGLRDG